MSPAERNTNYRANHRTSHTAHCTRQKSLRNGPTYIFLSDPENSSPPPRMATPPSQRLTAPSRIPTTRPTLRNMSAATKNPPSRLPRIAGTPMRGTPVARTPRDSAVWLKLSPPESPIRPLDIRKASSSATTSQMKPLPSAPTATASRAASPAQGSRSLLDATERELSPSQFPVLSATPPGAVSASPSSPSGRGSNDKRSGLPRATFWPGGRDSLTSDRPATSPGRAYSPPATSYSTVRPVRNSAASAASAASLSSTPRKGVASHLDVRRTNAALLVTIPTVTTPPQPAEQAVPSLNGEVAVKMEEEAAPAPVVHRSAEQRDDGGRGRKGLFRGSKSKENRSKSKSRMALEKMTGFIRKRASQVEMMPGSRPQVSAPVEGSFVHQIDPNDETVPSVPALPAAKPLIPDRPPPAVPTSQPTASRAPGPSQSPAQANDVDSDEDVDEQQEENEETDLIAASQHLRSLADEALTDETKKTFLVLAKAFGETKVLVTETAIAMEKAKRHAQDAMWYFSGAKINAMKIEKIARALNVKKADDGEQQTTTETQPRARTHTTMRTATSAQPQARARTNIPTQTQPRAQTESRRQTTQAPTQITTQPRTRTTTTTQPRANMTKTQMKMPARK